MSTDDGLRTAASSPDPDPTLSLDEAIIEAIIEPIMGPILPLILTNVEELLARITHTTHHLAIRNATNLSAARQYRSFLHTTAESIDALNPVITPRDRTQMRAATRRLADSTTKTRMHISNSLARAKKAEELMGRVCEGGEEGRGVKEGLFREAQREVAVAVAEERSAGRCLEKGAGEVEVVVELLGVLVGEMEERRRREARREWIRLDSIEEGGEDGGGESGKGGEEDWGVVREGKNVNGEVQGRRDEDDPSRSAGDGASQV